MNARRSRPRPVEPEAAPAVAQRWGNRFACAGLAAGLGVVFVYTLYPGVNKGDSAELQYMCALLGVCHSPGYAIEVIAGNLFSLLPIGPNIAWRISLLQAVCGVVGCLALYGTLRRLTGQVLPALVATTTLAFSTIYWRYSCRAEVYVFYGMFLLLGIYALVRFLKSDKSAWLFLAALLLGVSVGGRLPEVLMLPALLGLWWQFRDRVRLSVGRIVVSGMLAAAPFVVSVCFYVAREDPVLLHARDDAYRDRVLGVGRPFPQRPLTEQLGEAILYTLGLRTAGGEDFTEFSWERVGWDLDKYGWLLSGLGCFGDRFGKTDPLVDPDLHMQRREQGRGTCIGGLGLLLAIWGLRQWRAQRGVVLLGLGMFLGNLVFYVCVHPVDNLDFIIPGLIGLAILVGLGVSTRAGGEFRGRQLVFQVACLAAPAFLAVSNYHIIDPRTPETQEHLDLCARVATTPLPEKPVIIATYSRTHTLRYVYWLDAGRSNVRVIVFRERYQKDDLFNLVNALQRRGHTVLFSTEAITQEKVKMALAAGTPRELIEVGLFWAYSPRQRPPGAAPE